MTLGSINWQLVFLIMLDTLYMLNQLIYCIVYVLYHSWHVKVTRPFVLPDSFLLSSYWARISRKQCRKKTFRGILTFQLQFVSYILKMKIFSKFRHVFLQALHQVYPSCRATDTLQALLCWASICVSSVVMLKHSFLLKSACVCLVALCCSVL